MYSSGVRTTRYLSRSTPPSPRSPRPRHCSTAWPEFSSARHRPSLPASAASGISRPNPAARCTLRSTCLRPARPRHRPRTTTPETTPTSPAPPRSSQRPRDSSDPRRLLHLAPDAGKRDASSSTPASYSTRRHSRLPRLGVTPSFPDSASLPASPTWRHPRLPRPVRMILKTGTRRQDKDARRTGRVCPGSDQARLQCR